MYALVFVRYNKRLLLQSHSNKFSYDSSLREGAFFTIFTYYFPDSLLTNPILNHLGFAFLSFYIQKKMATGQSP